MLGIYIGTYAVLLIAIWAFFLVARHHSLKFKKFSTNIQPVTNILFIFLVILSILGFISIFYLGEDTRVIRVDTKKTQTQSYY